MLNSGRVELLDIPRLATQLVSLERRAARGGRYSIDHPPGAHDDLITAATGALLAASRPSGYKTSLDWVGSFNDWGMARIMNSDW